MFFPETMTEVELIVPSKDLLVVTKVLGNKGVFHQIDSTIWGWKIWDQIPGRKKLPLIPRWSDAST